MTKAQAIKTKYIIYYYTTHGNGSGLKKYMNIKFLSTANPGYNTSSKESYKDLVQPKSVISEV